VIAALPAILAEHPDGLYVVLGATHPHLVRREGEAYRERLAARAADLGVQDRVLFLDRYVELPELLALADRIIVLAEGQLTAEFPRAEATEQRIMEAATGGYAPR
jgi:glycosyltransferase involved in cell wall biosynthesis